MKPSIGMTVLFHFRLPDPRANDVVISRPAMVIYASSEQLVDLQVFYGPDDQDMKGLEMQGGVAPLTENRRYGWSFLPEAEPAEPAPEPEGLFARAERLYNVAFQARARINEAHLGSTDALPWDPWPELAQGSRAIWYAVASAAGAPVGQTPQQEGLYQGLFSTPFAERRLDNVDPASAAASTPDIKVSGDPGAWELVAKASSHAAGWMKSTKRMRVPGGWLFQVSTEHRYRGTNSILRDAPAGCAEALAFVPDEPPETPEEQALNAQHEADLRVRAAEQDRDANVAAAWAVVDKLRDFLIWHDKGGGLGLDIHERIRTLLEDTKRKTIV